MQQIIPTSVKCSVILLAASPNVSLSYISWQQTDVQLSANRYTGKYGLDTFPVTQPTASKNWIVTQPNQASSMT